ncbi:MAG: M48 family metalloprotease [Kiloniellales bacterium]
MAAALIASQSTPAVGLSLIRDAEIEHSLRVWSTPIFDSAGLIAEDIDLYLVNDKQINAFVAGGQNLFIHTGLLARSEHAGQVMGVIAHETGHIAAGHLVRRHQALRDASAEAIIGTLLGAAAGIASGRADVGLAGISAGHTYAQRKLLAYTRSQESVADQAALSYLEANGVSARGLIEFFQIVGGEERKITRATTPYLRTHPLNTERIRVVRAHIAGSPFSDRPLPQAFEVQHQRLRGKLIGFLEPPERVFNNYYRADDGSLEARYARAIAHYKIPDMPAALRAIDALIAEQPDDPFFHELRGQMLFENGRIREALPSYERAVELFPHSGLLRVELAQALVELDDRRADYAAIIHLNEALHQEDRNAQIWRLLAVAHGRTGNLGMTSLALAERAMLQHKKDEALGQAERAERLLPEGSPGWLRAQDILYAAKKRGD